ncbi:hypothetical protein AMTRI_Chr01g132110 [Amborella trichopoda]
MEHNVFESGEACNRNVCDSSNLNTAEESGVNKHVVVKNESQHRGTDSENEDMATDNENENMDMDNKNEHVGTNNEMVDNSMGNATVDCEVRRNLEPFEGMVFESEETVRTFYNEYARWIGFSIRNSVNRRKNGENIARYFVCSKEGFREKKHLMSEQPRPHTREGCKAMIYAKKVESGQWIIRKFVKEHSHPMVSPNNVVLLRSHRRAANRAKNFANTFDKEHNIQVEERSHELNVQVQDNSSHEPLTLRYNDLCEHALKVAAEGATTAEFYRIAMHGIQKVLQEVINAKVKTITQIGGVQGDNTCEVSEPATMENVNLEDPQQTKTREISRPNLDLENATKRRKTCINCKQQGHDKRTCSYLVSKGNSSNNVVGVPTSATPGAEFDHSSLVAFGGL